MTHEEFRKQLMQDLESLYQMAMEQGKVSIAMKAKEMLAREYGFSSQNQAVDLIEFCDKMTEEELESFVGQLQSKLESMC